MRLRWVSAGLLLAAVLGCSGVSVRPVSKIDLLAAWQASIAADDLSPRTQQTLRRWDLDATYRRSREEAFFRLQGIVNQEPQPDLVFACAEIAYLLARQSEKRHTEACAYYYLCAGYAYHFLFPCPHPGVAPADDGPRFTPAGECVAPANSFDPRFRLACDLYNTALSKCIRAAQAIGRLDPRVELRLPTPDGRGFQLSVVQHGFAWRPEEFGPLLFCCDFEVQGLTNHHRTYGLGVPLIGTRVTPSTAAPGQAFYPKEVSFPVTAFFRFGDSLADLRDRRSGRLELYNPLTVQGIEVKGRTVPLETDLTTPLAYFLSRTDLEGIEYTGFFKADEVANRAGIYLFEPYQPGKIPVLMVHGLLSSPLTWAPMFNDLRADPVLRERFQFWFYLYPTAEPYLVAAADLRADLARLRDEVDPTHCDPALDQLVCVGHSMGGLVSRLLTVDSGDDFRNLLALEPREVAQLQPETRAELHRVFWFDRQPAVKRVVFLGTPHHGSKLSPSSAGRLLTRVVGLPKTLLQTTADVLRAKVAAGDLVATESPPSSIDLLAPGAPALELLASRPKPADVQFHSIIGLAPANNSLLSLARVFAKVEDWSDGVVPYYSAHLDGTASELLVQADHTHVHQHPLAILEVRRILLDHWKAVNGPR